MIQKLLHYIVVLVKLTTTFCIVWFAVDLVLWYGGSKEFNWWTIWAILIAVAIGVPATIGEFVLYAKSEEARIKKTPDWKTRFPKATDFTVKEIAEGEHEAAMKIWKEAKSQHGNRLIESGFHQRLDELAAKKK